MPHEVLGDTGMALCVFNVGQDVVAGEHPRLAVAMAAVIVVASIILGYGDGRANLGFARRQTLQFVLASIITLGTLPILYTGAYSVGKQMWRKGLERNRQAKPHD